MVVNTLIHPKIFSAKNSRLRNNHLSFLPLNESVLKIRLYSVYVAVLNHIN